jgi:hypothetical protein
MTEIMPSGIQGYMLLYLKRGFRTDLPKVSGQMTNHADILTK